MHRQQIVLLLVISFCSMSLSARMYQWVNPSSGRTQVTGNPPTWYRNGNEGPRVFVFENGRLVDDTSIKVSEKDRLALYHKAFTIEKPSSVEKQSLKESDANDLQEEAEEEAGSDINSATKRKVSRRKQDDEKSTSPEAVTPLNTEPEAEAIKRLKSIISEWDNRRTQEALKFLESSQISPKPSRQDTTQQLSPDGDLRQ